MLVLLRTALGDCGEFAWLKVSVRPCKIIDCNNLTMLDIFGMISGMTVLIVGTEEFGQLITTPGDDSDLRFTFAAITQRAPHNSDPFVILRVEIIGAMLFPEANVGRKWPGSFCKRLCCINFSMRK